MVTQHRSMPLTDGVLTLLRTTGILIGDAAKPSGAGWQGTPGKSDFVPYADVWPSVGGDSDGSLAEGDGFTDVGSDYLIRTFGATRRQVELVVDKVWVALLEEPGAQSIPLIGRRVLYAEPDMLGGVVRDTSIEPSLYYAPARWRFHTRSAA